MTTTPTKSTPPSSETNADQPPQPKRSEHRAANDQNDEETRQRIAEREALERLARQGIW